jgi:hypothetical protein
MWKNITERGRPKMTTWPMHIAGWILKSTNTHSEYVIHVLVAFPLLQRFYERFSALHFGTLPVLLTAPECISMIALMRRFLWESAPGDKKFTSPISEEHLFSVTHMARHVLRGFHTQTDEKQGC